MRRNDAGQAKKLQGLTKIKVGIVVSDYNYDVTHSLLAGALEVLHEAGVQKKNITQVHVPGGFEIPLGCRRLLAAKKADAVIALGCVLKGETKHDEYISFSVAHALQMLMMQYGKPVSFGVLTPNTLEQALERSKPGVGNKGREAATAALSML
jgi:6,7-dimethyl-8-ribityllumazine synthase